MVAASVPARVRLDRLPVHAWAVIAVVGLALLYTLFEVALVRPALWPAGTGALLAADPASRLPLIARPPDVRKHLGQPVKVMAVAASSPAEAAGLRVGDEIREVAGAARGVDLRVSARRSLMSELETWRALYWVGVRGPVSWTVRDAAGERLVTVDRVSAWRSQTDGWWRLHFGMIVQVVVFIGGALVLLLLRSDDLSAGLCVLALALSAVGSGGPLLGAETAMPFGRVLTLLAWMASPLAFPIIALAILHFPARSPLIVRRPWLQAIPFVTKEREHRDEWRIACRNVELARGHGPNQRFIRMQLAGQRVWKNV